MALATAVGPGLISSACGSGSGASSGTGGKSGSGGAVGAGGISGTGGAGASCSNVTACGGNLVGTWTVTSSCLKVSGNLDPSLVGAGCSSAPVTGDLQVSGTWTAVGDGTYTDDTVTTGTEQFMLGPSCLMVSSTPVSCDGAAGFIQALGFASLTCTSAAGGGCNCSGTVQQTGGLGLLSPAPSTSGNYTAPATRSRSPATSATRRTHYCVSGSKLTVTPQSTSPTMTGTIVLQPSATTGTGGTAGTGGARARAARRGPAAASARAARRATGGATARGAQVEPAARAGTGGNGRLGRSWHGRPPGDRGTGGAAGSGAAVGPCDIYANAGNPCVAAHSTVRALFGAYSGKLYQVRNAAGTTKDILTLTPGGFADGGLARHVLFGNDVRHHRRLRSIGQGERPLVPGIDDGARLDVEQPVEGDQRVADAQRSQGVLALHQPGQQLLGRRLEVGHRARQSSPKACTW